MTARLGNVLHWVANTVAILLLVVGAFLGWAEYVLPAFGHSSTSARWPSFLPPHRERGS